jgi:hypothetical protein
VLDHIIDNERPLTIRSFGIRKIMAFDLGTAWLDIDISPNELTQLLVRRGFAVADEDPRSGLHGETTYIVRRLHLIKGKQLRTFERTKLADDKHQGLLRRLRHDIDSFSSYSRENAREVAELQGQFQMMSSLLAGYLKWDKEKQSPEYVARGRFTRAIFNPMLMAFDDLGTDFFTVQSVLSIFKNGTGSITLWIDKLSSNRKSGFSTEEILALLRSLPKIPVKVALSERTVQFAAKAAALYGLNLLRRTDLDSASNSTEVAKSLGLTFHVYEAPFMDVNWIYVCLIYDLCLELKNLKTTPAKLAALGQVGYFSYSIINLYDMGLNVHAPFKQIVERHPRQLYALLAGEEKYKATSDREVRNTVLDLSPVKNYSTLLASVASLIIFPSDKWIELRAMQPWLLYSPALADIGDCVAFEMLCCLRQVLDGYNLLLSKMLDSQTTMSSLVKAERKITSGLEEIYPSRHALYASVRHWWAYCESVLGIKELNDGVNDKLRKVHNIIVTERQHQLDTRLLYLTIVIAVLTVATFLGSQRIWDFLSLLWSYFVKFL